MKTKYKKFSISVNIPIGKSDTKKNVREMAYAPRWVMRHSVGLLKTPMERKEIEAIVDNYFTAKIASMCGVKGFVPETFHFEVKGT